MEREASEVLAGSDPIQFELLYAEDTLVNVHEKRVTNARARLILLNNVNTTFAWFGVRLIRKRRQLNDQMPVTG
ncbi:hypothetical protein D3C75_1303920 [compost metagenome]